jgi:hypothetical protein
MPLVPVSSWSSNPSAEFCYAIEIDPLYIDTAVKRWEQNTGEKAACSATGERLDQVEVLNGEGY